MPSTLSHRIRGLRSEAAKRLGGIFALGCLTLAAGAVPSVALDPGALDGTWPDPQAIADRSGQDIRFPSHSPFVLSDVGTDDDPATDAVGTLFLPDGDLHSPPWPAVVLQHGASGVSDARELTYGRQFAAMGIAALVVDSFAARRDIATGFSERILKITESMFIADAYAGLRYLAGRADIDAGRIALIGFSYGGMVSVLSAYAQVARTFAPGSDGADGPRFAGHAAFYGPCIARFSDTRTTGAPVLMLAGAEDELVVPARCREILDDLRGGGSDADLVIYDGAYHKWDGSWGGPYRIGRNLKGCRFRVERDGVVRDLFSWLPMTNSITRQASLLLCVDDEGYLIGRDDAVRARSNRDLGAFLKRALTLR